MDFATYNVHRLYTMILKYHYFPIVTHMGKGTYKIKFQGHHRVPGATLMPVKDEDDETRGSKDLPSHIDP